MIIYLKFIREPNLKKQQYRSRVENLCGLTHVDTIGTYIAIVTIQQSSCGVRCWVGHHVFAWVVERRQIPGVHLGVVCAGSFPTDAVQQFGLGILLSVAPTTVDPQRLFSAGA